jgi:predicted small lipoprotein YifL
MRCLGLIVLVLCALCGCGQKGPLYLPDHKPAAVTAPTPGPTTPGPSGTAPNNKKNGQDDSDPPQ